MTTEDFLARVLAWDGSTLPGRPCSGHLLKMMLLALWTMRDQAPTTVEIASAAGCGERTCYRALEALREAGILRFRDGSPSFPLWQ